MGLRSTIQDDMKTAMKAKEMDRVGTLRLLVSELKKREIDQKTEFKDADIMKVIGTMVKQRRDSVDAFKKGGRDDLAAKEEAEIVILQAYLPEQLSREKLTEIVSEVIAEVGATSMKEMGKVIPAVMAKVAGQAEGKMVSEIVREKLS